MATIADLEKQLAEIKQQHKLLSHQVEWMQMVIRMVGVDGPWVSPQIAGTALGRSRDRVADDIRLAESIRSLGKRQVDMVYGVHYRNDQTIDSTHATWKVHLLKYAEYTMTPPDQLKVA